MLVTTDPHLANLDHLRGADGGLEVCEGVRAALLLVEGGARLERGPDRARPAPAAAHRTAIKSHRQPQSGGGTESARMKEGLQFGFKAAGASHKAIN